jgi:hypothetical protein
LSYEKEFDMTQTTSWSCPGCGWAIGQVRDGDLHLYSQAVAGSGQGETPLVLAVMRMIHRTPVRCTHCGHVEVWDANLRVLVGVLERSLGRPLSDDERRRLAGEIMD